jgi:hypothetical protein
MIETKVVKIFLTGNLAEIITETCGIYGADGWLLGGVIPFAHEALLIFQKYASQDPTTTSGPGAS